MAAEPLITTEGLYRYYGDRCAVQDLNLELQRGEVLGLLGPNGAGKSTTLGMIAGNLAPSSGRIRLNGVDLLRHPIKAKANLGYLPENPPLYRELTVDEYLHHCARLRAIPAGETGIRTFLLAVPSVIRLPLTDNPPVTWLIINSTPALILRVDPRGIFNRRIWLIK